MKKYILITGGTGLIGTILVKQLVKTYQVIVIYRNQTKFQRWINKNFTPKIYPYIHGVHIDLTEKNYLNMLNFKLERFLPNIYGFIYGIRNVNTLGPTPTKNDFIQEFTEQVIIPYEIITTYGKIFGLKRAVLLGSMYGKVIQNPNLYENGYQSVSPVYGITKATMHYLIKFLGAKYAELMTVNGVAYGGVESSLMSEEFKKKYAKMTPKGRILKDKDIYSVINFLLNKNSEMITGEVISVDGGWTLW